MTEPTIPAGTYPARAVEFKLDQSSQSGTEYAGVTFEILDEELKGERIEWQGWLTEKALPYTVKALQNAGWHGDDIENAMRDGLGSTDCDIVVEWDEYKGKMRAKVAFVKPPTRPLDGSKKKSIKDRVAAVVAAQKKGDTKKTDGGPKVDPNDDLNF